MTRMSVRRLTSLALVAALFTSACSNNDGGPSNSAPVAADDSATTLEDTAVSVAVLANDTDADGQDDLDPASVSVNGVTHGTTSIDTSTGEVTFTPDQDYSGSAGFNYVVSDQAGKTSKPAKVDITVQAANDAPRISDITDRTIAEDGTTGAISFNV